MIAPDTDCPVPVQTEFLVFPHDIQTFVLVLFEIRDALNISAHESESGIAILTQETSRGFQGSL